MKKILLVTRPIAPPWDEGSKNFAYYLAKNISDLEMHLMTKGILPNLASNIRQHPIYATSEIAHFNFFEKLRAVFFQFKSRGNFNISHYFFTPTKLNSFLIKNFLKSKDTKTIQTVATLREDLWSNADIKNLMFADLIITYSDYSKNKLESLGFKNVKRIYPGIDLSKFSSGEKNPEILKRHHFSTSDFIINFTGEYARLGAIDILIDSFIEISKMIPNAKLSLALRIKNKEDAAKKEKTISRLKQNNLLEKTAFHDDRAFTMRDIYNLCDISLFPVTNMKGKFDIPLAVVEAMACEKPVILSDLPILSELTNGKNSVIIPKGNVAALIKATLDLYENQTKREEIGREARKFVEENFDIKKIADIYKQIYETL